MMRKPVDLPFDRQATLSSGVERWKRAGITSILLFECVNPILFPYPINHRATALPKRWNCRFFVAQKGRNG
ncbi:hypothetical protein AU377_03540 [Sporosarcina sp. HYO08]|nr:hypothetical protein AU377_03540 [Sporosarcina sp. HYO08]